MITSGYKAQNAETLSAFAEADFDATIVVPDHFHYSPPPCSPRRSLTRIPWMTTSAQR
jgi:hypothetical protein